MSAKTFPLLISILSLGGLGFRRFVASLRALRLCASVSLWLTIAQEKRTTETQIRSERDVWGKAGQLLVLVSRCLSWISFERM